MIEIIAVFLNGKNVLPVRIALSDSDNIQAEPPEAVFKEKDCIWDPTSELAIT
jgi:hypothetical protein